MSSAAPTAIASQAQANRLLVKRKRADRRFQLYGILAISAAVGFLVVFLASIVSRGYLGFVQTEVQLTVNYEQSLVEGGSYRKILRTSLAELFPDAGSSRSERRALAGLVSAGTVFTLREAVEADPTLIGTVQDTWVLASGPVDQFYKGRIDASLPEDERPISDASLARITALEEAGRIGLRFNRNFFSRGDSRNPEEAGILGAMVGSALALIVTLALSFPVGVMTAVYLESFAPRNRITRLIEININNLAAVPSIVFGLLGLAVFLNVFGLPRSAPLAGGLVLSLMTLPTIIISSRAAIRAVPPSFAEAAIGLGASRVQAIFHHVLPAAAPGTLTGAIIGMAQALGETAPLLMIGMVAFVVEVPGGFTDPSTVLPAQVYLWADSPERGFAEKTAAAIMVLLGFLLAMNGFAVYLRRKFEKQW